MESPSRYTRWLQTFRALPGTKQEYLLLCLVALDNLLLVVMSTYRDFLGRQVVTAIIIFDFLTIGIWLIDYLVRLKRSKDRSYFMRAHWYELVGLVPVAGLRLFLLLRAAKLVIAFYKLGRSEQKISRLITRDITFRFRDIIVDTIADAVFLQSLDRVEEVMSRLDYGRVAASVFESRKAELEEIVSRSLMQKSMVGELSRIPMMGGFTARLGKDVTAVIVEVMETEAVGAIFKGIVQQVLLEMSERVRLLDVERLTGQEIELHRAATIAEGES
ncbi:MAG: hypothetical protein HS115_16720 [Spirochaetales bacterium]|nr:hypothetical protein [Spirochaetales bacterium]